MTNTKEKEPLLDADSAMNSKAGSIKKSDLIIIKHHPEYQGQMYCVSEVKRDGSVITNGGHIFYPEFFDKISNWEEYNGGFARFNQATGELVEEINIKEYLELRSQLNDGKDGWCDRMVIESELELDQRYVKNWLTENEGTLVECHSDGEHWRLINSKAEKLKKLEQEIHEIRLVIINSFYEIGIRLAQIRDEKLYELKNCIDFKDYIAKHFPFGSNYAYKQIAAAEVFESIRPVIRRNYTICTLNPSECTNCTLDLKESHLRPLTKEGLTVEDKRNIWENVEIELADMELVKGKPRLTSTLVEKTVWEFTQDKNAPQPQPLSSGQICKVELKSNIDSGLKQHNKKLVRVVEQNNRGVLCTTLWGEPVEDCFFREELQDLKDEEFYSSSINLPVEFWKKLSKKGRSLNEAILHLLEEKQEV